METSTSENSSEGKKADSYIYYNTAQENIHTACSVVGKTVAGLGVGVVAGISLVVAAAAVEVAVPAILVLKALGLTGGALGFVTGIKKE